MTLSIESLGSVIVTTPSATTNAIALNQTALADANADASPVTIRQVTPAAGSPKLAAALKALGTTSKLAGDLQDVASALVPSMQKIVEERPDLATAHFDFQSADGSIRIVSDSLSNSDKAWLEKTLNANRGLVDAVQTFHSDATASYALWADAAGQPLSPADSAKASELASNTFNFLDMFNRGSRAMAQVMGSGGSYVTPAGASMNFNQTVDSALSFLVFQKSNQAIVNGTDTYSDGAHTIYGAMQGNFFSMPGVIPGFMPATPSNSLGLSATA